MEARGGIAPHLPSPPLVLGDLPEENGIKIAIM
jgi:hypothetical protein